MILTKIGINRFESTDSFGANPIADSFAAKFGRRGIAADFQQLVDNFLRVFKILGQSAVVNADYVAEVRHADF